MPAYIDHQAWSEEMRKLASLALMIALAVAGVPCGVVAAPQVAAGQAQSGAVAGTARGANARPIPNATIQIRNVETGALVGTTTTGDAGEFAFAGLPSGTYVVEVVDVG